jgi:signal transduction histidine kinase
VKGISSGKKLAGIVSMQGKVLPAAVQSEKGAIINLATDGWIVRLFAPPESSIFKPEMRGKEISVEGAFRWANQKDRATPELWLSEASAFQIITNKSRTPLIVSLSFLLGIALSAWAFQFMQRKKPAAAPGTQPEALVFSIEGREKLARDWHDGVIQSLYAIGLSIENCLNLLQKSPGEAQSRLESIIQQLSTSINQLRSVISGLGTEPLKPGEFKAALKSVILTQGESQVSKIILEVDQPASEQLTSAQATHLLHIAREALSNSLRHAQPGRVTIAFHKASASDFVFEVTDDGEGFDEKKIQKGHGLRNIDARVRDLRGAWSLASGASLGTKITINLPIETN